MSPRRPRTDLETYPRPGVTVDLAVVTVARARSGAPGLQVLLVDRDQDPAGLALPGGFMRERWTVERTTESVLRRKVGLTVPGGAEPQLLRVFDDPHRDSRTWALSVAHLLCLPEGAVDAARGRWVVVRDDGTLDLDVSLLFDHDEIVAAAVETLRRRYEIRRRYLDARPDPDGFLGETFTLLQLRRVHEAVVGDALHKDNFARRMTPYLEPVLDADGRPVLVTDGPGRPARLFRKAPPSPVCTCTQ